jgi:predicted membrane protein
MSKPITLQAEFTIGRSKIVLVMICVLHILSLLASWIVYFPITVKLMLSFLIILSCLYQYHTYQTGSLFLRYTSDHGWSFCLKNSEPFKEIKIQASSVVFRLLTILHISSEKTQKTLVIFNDAMSHDDYRRFMILLRTTD